MYVIFCPMQSFRSWLNRALFTFGYIRGLFIVWQRLDPDPLLFLHIAIIGAIFTALFDRGIDWGLRKLDRYLDSAARLIAAALVIALLLILPVPVPITIHLAGAVVFAGLLWKVGNHVIPLERFDVVVSWQVWINNYPSFKALFPSFTLPSFSPKHGAYALFPLKMSLLFYL